jgi:hypothetical protein
VTYELHVRQRDGAKFKGHVCDNGPGRNRAEIEGEVGGEAITWREQSVSNREALLAMRGTIRGGGIRLTFKGYHGKAARRTKATAS